MTALLSVTQAAALAACTRRYILDEIEAKRLPAEKIGATYVIRREDFDKWLSNPRRGERSKRK